MSVLKLLSVFVCVLLTVGYFNRTRKRIHIPLMVSSLLIDLGLVLYLEITRAVVESVVTSKMTPLLIVHISLSTVVLGMYGMQVVTGIKKARGGTNVLHGRCGIVLLVTRFGNLITSFAVT